MKTAFFLNHFRFASCASARRLLKRCKADSAGKKLGSWFFSCEEMKNSIAFTRHEILEEVSSGQPIHPSIERTVSRHE
jgi:hypothetical protein